VEREHVARVFAATGSHKSRTAQILGVSRPRLDRLLRKHRIE
jgi:ActR/RegA family two-component response regulator